MLTNECAKIRRFAWLTLRICPLEHGQNNLYIENYGCPSQIPCGSIAVYARGSKDLSYRWSLWPVNCALRLDPPDEMVVVVGEPDRAVVEVNRVAAAAVPLRDDAVRACVDLRQRNAD
jgi:hypothetical protein